MTMTALSVKNMNWTVGNRELETTYELTMFERIALKLELAYKLQDKQQDEHNRMIGNNLEASALHELLNFVDGDPAHNTRIGDQREARRRDILYALSNEPMSVDTANELMSELAELEASTQANPPEFGSAAWFADIKEIEL